MRRLVIILATIDQIQMSRNIIILDIIDPEIGEEVCSNICYF